MASAHQHPRIQLITDNMIRNPIKGLKRRRIIAFAGMASLDIFSFISGNIDEKFPARLVLHRHYGMAH
jgi:hypothetical protein